VHIILYNEPLLFVDGPPVFIRVDIPIIEDESTSVFSMVEEVEEGLDLAQLDAAELHAEEIKYEPEIMYNPSIRRRMAYLEGALQKEMYRPLQFDMENTSVIGSIDKIDGEIVFIELRGEQNKVVALEISKIEEILWRGKPFAEY